MSKSSMTLPEKLDRLVELTEGAWLDDSSYDLEKWRLERIALKNELKVVLTRLENAGKRLEEPKASWTQ